LAGKTVILRGFIGDSERGGKKTGKVSKLTGTCEKFYREKRGDGTVWGLDPTKGISTDKEGVVVKGHVE